jgi:hypothetical protein
MRSREKKTELCSGEAKQAESRSKANINIIIDTAAALAPLSALEALKNECEFIIKFPGKSVDDDNDGGRSSK